MSKITRCFRFLGLNIIAVATLVGCGGAPGDSSGTTSGTSDGGGGVVTAPDFATSISMSGDLNNANTLDTDGVEVQISVLLSNLVGNPAVDGQIVEFVSPELGIFQQEICVVEGLGCSVTWISAGNRVTNPLEATPEQRSILVMAIVPGAEEFIDENGNDLYDPGEPFADFPEPWVDENGSGAYELGEHFEDLNNNGVLDGGNGLWDGPCSFRTGECDGNNEAILFDWQLIYLCGSREIDPDPNCADDAAF